MGGNNNEIDEKPRNVEQSDGGNLSVNVLERDKTTAESQQQRQLETQKLEAKGALPEMQFAEARTGTELSRSELAKEGVSCRREKDAEGEMATKVDFPNGVKVEVKPETTVTVTLEKEDGTTKDVEVTSGGTVLDLSDVKPQPLTEKPKGSGTIVDGKGNQIVKHNEDGSYTVATDASHFYTVHKDGTVRKETAIRSRDGKSWDVLDTNNPLGGMKRDK